jgi:hypothetical protein
VGLQARCRLSARPSEGTWAQTAFSTRKIPLQGHTSHKGPGRLPRTLPGRGLRIQPCSFKSEEHRRVPPSRQCDVGGGAWLSCHWLSHAVFWNVCAGVERSDWIKGLLVCVPPGSLFTRGALAFGSWVSHVPFPGGSGFRFLADPLRIPVGAWTPRRWYDWSGAERGGAAPGSPSPGSGVRSSTGRGRGPR